MCHHTWTTMGGSASLWYVFIFHNVMFYIIHIVPMLTLPWPIWKMKAWFCFPNLYLLGENVQISMSKLLTKRNRSNEIWHSVRKIKLSESCTHWSPGWVWVTGCATIRFDFVIQQQQVNINLIPNCFLSTNTLNNTI